MLTLRNGILILVCLLVGILAVADRLGSITIFDRSPDPSFVKISLAEAGTVADFRFRIKKHFPYWFVMRFWFPENDKVERARIRKILGESGVNQAGKPAEPGIPTPITLNIFAVCPDGKEVKIYAQDTDPILASWGADHFGKIIGSHVLAPGVYRARLVNHRASQELASVPITFHLFLADNVIFNSKNSPVTSDPCQQ